MYDVPDGDGRGNGRSEYGGGHGYDYICHADDGNGIGMGYRRFSGDGYGCAFGYSHNDFLYSTGGRAHLTEDGLRDIYKGSLYSFLKERGKLKWCI